MKLYHETGKVKYEQNNMLFILSITRGAVNEKCKIQRVQMSDNTGIKAAMFHNKTENQVHSPKSKAAIIDNYVDENSCNFSNDSDYSLNKQ